MDNSEVAPPGGRHRDSLAAVLLQPDMLKIFVSSLFVLGQVLVSFSLIPLYIQYRGGDTFTIGVHTTVFAVASVALRFIFGPMADVQGRRSVMALGAFVFSTANLAVFYAPSLLWMAIARVYQAVGMASYLSSASSLVADMAPFEYRGSVIGAYRMILPVASLTGPFLGNDIIRRFGFRAFFFAMAGAAFISFLLVLALKSGRRPVGYVNRIRPSDIISIFRNRELRAAYSGIFTVSLGGGIITTYIITYGAPYFRNAAVFFIVYAFVGAPAALMLGRLSDRTGRRRLALPIIVLLGAGTALLALIDAYPAAVFFAAAVLTGVGYNAGLSVFISWVVDAVDNRLRATALSLQESGIDTGFAVGIFLFGSWAAVHGQASAFFWTGVVLVLGGIGIGRRSPG